MCVCVCVYPCHANHANHATQIVLVMCLAHKSMPNTISLSYSTTMLFCPTNPPMTKTTFDFLFQNSEFYFHFSVTPPWVSISVCPLTKPP